MKRIIITATAMLFALFVLAGCGGSPSSDPAQTDSSSPSAEQTSENTETSAADNPADPEAPSEQDAPSGAMTPAEQHAYVQQTLDRAYGFGYSQAALDLLKEAADATGDSRLISAYRQLDEGHYRQSKVVQTLTDGSYWTWANEISDDGSSLLQTRTYTDAHGEAVPFMTVRTDEVFDEGGNYLVQTDYYGEGPDVAIVTTWEYDARGNMVRETEEADGSVTHSTEWAYDEHGNELSCHQQLLVEGGVRSSHEYKRNADGRVIEHTYYGKDKAVTEVDKYTYDENGLVSVQSQTYPTGEGADFTMEIEYAFFPYA